MTRAARTISEAARAALRRFSNADIEAGVTLVHEQRENAFSARFQDDGQTFSVLWEHSPEGDRLACTCGVPDCPHQAALLSLLDAGAAAFAPNSTSEAAVETDVTLSPAPKELPNVDIDATLRHLIDQVCRHGIFGESPARDLALQQAIDALADRDLPDLKRTLAALRRALLTKPSTDRALTALARLAALSDAAVSSTRDSFGSFVPRRDLDQDISRKEEVRLLEIARRTQRTPFGDRRDVSFFLDLDDREIYRELGSAAPGNVPKSLSDGPFPKRLLGNLVAVESGPKPRRIRLLQFASAGFATEGDLNALIASAETDVSALYDLFKSSAEETPEGFDPLVVFAPDIVKSCSNGVVFLDDHGGILPLNRSIKPMLSETVDLLAQRGSIQAIVGNLSITAEFLALLPLTVLVELNGQRSLRRLT